MSHKPTKEQVDQLMKAARDGDIATLQHLIQEKQIDVDTRGPRDLTCLERTPLLVSASHGRSNAVHNLMKLGANIHAVDWDGDTVLHCAAKSGSTSLIEHFIKAGLDVNVVDKFKYTPLHLASQYDHVAAVNLLMRKGAAINQNNNDGMTVLHFAARNGNISLTECFIKAGLSVNVVDKDKNTPLHLASRDGHVTTVKLLLRNGAEINQSNNVGWTPLQYAVEHNKSEVVWTFTKDQKVNISQYDEHTKQSISKLLTIEEEKRKIRQDPLTFSDLEVNAKQADLSHEVVNKAFMDSTLPSPDVRVAMLGTEGSGKTCLADTLTGQDFKFTQPTEGADEMEVVVKNSIDWSVLPKEKIIESLQQQVLQEATHCVQELQSTPNDSTTFTAKLATDASLPLSCSSKTNPDPPLLPMLELPGGDKMYILTLEEFKQLPSIVEKYDPLRRYVNIWDYAGQHVFQHTHGLFVSEEVVCLIVFDASKLLDDIPERRYEGDKCPARSVIDTITYWMDLISCRVSKKSTSHNDLSEFLPTFILVGTKIDLLSSDIDQAEKIATQKFVPILKKKLACKPFAKHIAGSKNGQLFTQGSSSIFFLSNRVRSPKVVAELQHVILQASPRKSRPTRLVKMERKLMLLSHKENLSVVDIKQVKEVASSCGISSDDDQVLEVLKFFHQKGTLLYFHQVPALSNVIILCPQWLAKLLTYILTNLICQPAGPPLAQYAQERNEKGLLRQELIDFCIDKFLNEESRRGSKVPKLVGGDMIDLLLKFKLMVDVTNTSLVANTVTCRIFLVPHLLPVQEFIPTTDPCYKVFYYFPGHFIPDNLINQLIVKCAEWNKDHKFDFLRLAYQWVSMKLGNHQSYQLRPIHNSDIIELTIVFNPMMPHEEEITALTNTNQLITVVKTFIDDLMEESMTATFNQYPVKCYLPCPACSEIHVDVEKIKQNNSDFCPTSNKFIDMIRYHKMLTCKTSCKSIMLSEMFNQEPQMKHLINIVVPRIAGYWNDVAFNLDFSISTVQIISQKFPNDSVSCCKEVFKHWLNSGEGIRPKVWSTLLLSLNQLEHLQVATEEIEKELKRITNTLTT